MVTLIQGLEVQCDPGAMAIVELLNEEMARAGKGSFILKRVSTRVVIVDPEIQPYLETEIPRRLEKAERGGRDNAERPPFYQRKRN